MAIGWSDFSKNWVRPSYDQIIFCGVYVSRRYRIPLIFEHRYSQTILQSPDPLEFSTIVKTDNVCMRICMICLSWRKHMMCIFVAPLSLLGHEAYHNTMAPSHLRELNGWIGYLTIHMDSKTPSSTSSRYFENYADSRSAAIVRAKHLSRNYQYYIHCIGLLVSRLTRCSYKVWCMEALIIGSTVWLSIIITSQCISSNDHYIINLCKLSCITYPCSAM